MLLFIGVKTDKIDVKMFNGIVLISISGVYAFRSNGVHNVIHDARN